jgi:hypothetical protein
MKSSTPILLLIVLFTVAYVSMIYLVQGFSPKNVKLSQTTDQSSYQNPFDFSIAYKNPFDFPQQSNTTAMYHNPFFEEFLTGKASL